MARWIVFFEDLDEMRAIRREKQAAQLAYLDRHRDRILIAGGLHERPGEPHVGGLWVVEAESRGEVIDLIEDDPFYRFEYRRYRVLAWGKAFEDRPVVL